MSNGIEASIRALEQHWQLRLPAAWNRLYHAVDRPAITPCEFLSIEQMQDDTERWPGMLPQFLPFAHAAEDDLYGFYVPPITVGDDYPVLCWNHEYDYYYPVASGFGLFLRWCILVGRYEAQDLLDEDDPDYLEEEAQRAQFARMFALPASLMADPPPRNERELHERALAADSQGAEALAQLGSLWSGRGDLGRARDFFARASEAAPWFADPYYLLGDTYLAQGLRAQATPRMWRVLHCPTALSTRTSRYDLGEGRTDEEIQVSAAERCVGSLDAAALGEPDRLLLQTLAQGFPDAYSAEVRLALGDELAALGDSDGAEREVLNALTLAIEDETRMAAYERLVAFYNRAQRHRDAVLCERDAQLA